MAKNIRFYTGRGGKVFPIRTSRKRGYKPKMVKEKIKWAHSPVRKRNKRMSRVVRRR
ncbi:MAG: hypothetical protein ACYC4L_11380 [Chloroflexota bacterium]